MNWINLLHFYQPANTDYNFIKEALDQSYWRLLRLMEENEELRMTWNISGCLLERLQIANETEFIERLKKILATGRLELVSSSAYHGFLPALPEREIIYQIKANEKILAEVLGLKKKPAGFFLPELAYSPEVAKVIAQQGYSWILLDRISATKVDSELEPETYYLDQASGLKVLLTDRSLSNTYPPISLIENYQRLQNQSVITATDAELYGLRFKDPDARLEAIMKNREIITKTMSDYISDVEASGKKIKTLAFAPASWSTTEAEFARGEVFNLWDDKDNEIHQALWTLTRLALDLDQEYSSDKNYEWYRWHLVRGIASCTFWWASAYDFSSVYGPLAWSPDIIELGLEDLIRAVRSIADPKSINKKLEAEKHYLEIKRLIWQQHWQEHWLG